MRVSLPCERMRAREEVELDSEVRAFLAEEASAVVVASDLRFGGMMDGGMTICNLWRMNRV